LLLGLMLDARKVKEGVLAVSGQGGTTYALVGYECRGPGHRL
jgi:hypothetical protein